MRVQRTTILSIVGQARAIIRNYLFLEVAMNVTCGKVLKGLGAPVPLPGAGKKKVVLYHRMNSLLI